MDEIIMLENVVKMTDTNRRILSGIKLCIHEKERVLVCGNPGSGKDMLMRIIAGMDKPSDGKVFVMGQAVHEMDSDSTAQFRNRHIGIIRRDSGFMDKLSVYENISLPLAIRKEPSVKRKQAAKEMLKILGISHIAHAYPSVLSTYEKLVACAARALITHPEILMMYEVTADLSEREKEEFTGLMNAILQYGEYTVILFSAEPSNALCTDRTFLIEHGKIREERP